MKNDSKIVTFGPSDEIHRRKELAKLVRSSPIPDQELMMNIGLFLTPQNLSRILFMDFLYKKIIEQQGVIMEFGTRWGQNMSLFSAMRGIYEPYNRLRKIIGFDTFTGFPSVHNLDGDYLHKGGYSTPLGYEKHLAEILQLLEAESPISHKKKHHEIVVGDAIETVPHYFENNPHTVIALAYFDLDIYEPTKICLEAILPYITKGTVIGFDEANDETTPGESIAMREVLDLKKYSLKRFKWNSRTSYLVVE